MTIPVWWGKYQMDELEILRSKAASLIKNSGDDMEGMLKGAELLKKIEEIENYRAAVHKLNTDRPQGPVLQFLTVLAPVATVLILAGTLYLSVIQFRSGRTDAEWAEAVKSVTEQKSDALAAAELKGLRQLPDYRQRADELALDLLRRTRNVDTFRSLLETEFGKSLSWTDLTGILELDRSLTFTDSELERKWNKLSSDENNQMDAVREELKQVCIAVSPLLKSPRPSGMILDLHNVEFMDCDLSNTDLSGADLTGFNTSRVLLKGSNLSNVTKYEYSFWGKTAWWEAGRMSRELVDHLYKTAPFDPKQTPAEYGLQTNPTQKEFEDAVERLRKAKPIDSGR